MRRIMSVLAVLVVALGVAWAADQPALPDYTAAPYTRLGAYEGTPAFHREFKGTGELFATAPNPAPGANAVFVFKGEDGKLKYAEWAQIQDDGCTITRVYKRTDEKWVFEQDKRPCEEAKQEKKK